MPHKFRFGVQTSSAPSREAWMQRAHKLEDLGFSTLFIPDHFHDQLAPVPALMAAADATSTLRIGGMVFDNDYRHPVVFAKECATMDVLSDGRLEAIFRKWNVWNDDQRALYASVVSEVDRPSGPVAPVAASPLEATRRYLPALFRAAAEDELPDLGSDSAHHVEQRRVRFFRSIGEEFDDPEELAATAKREGHSAADAGIGSDAGAREIVVADDIDDPSRRARIPHTSGQSDPRGKIELAAA